MTRPLRLQSTLQCLPLALAALALLAGAARADDAQPVECKAGSAGSADARIDACNAAMATVSDPVTRSRLLFARAYAKNELQRYEDALVDLDEAVRLDPANASALHERAYALSSLMRYEEAIADLDAQLRITPNSASAYQERVYSLRHLARFKEAMDDLDRVDALKPNDAGHLIGRAQVAMWLGRFDQAKADLARASALAAAQHDDARGRQAMEASQTLTLLTERSSGPAPERNCLEADSKRDFTRPFLIGDCTAAYLAATTGKDKADALTVRAEAWLIGRRDEDAALEDMQTAAALDPDNAGLWSNLGYAYLRGRHSWAARKVFDRSIAIKPSFFAYAGRAEAKYNLGDVEGAFADAKTSFEMQPNEIALTLLGDIALDHFNDPKAAKGYWMAAYHLGDRDDDLIARLKQVGVDDPEKEPAGSR